jgi:hypothetical protein
MPFRLPAGGSLYVGGKNILTLAENAIFSPACSGQQSFPSPDRELLESETLVIDAGDPFYASTSPLVYAIAAATIVSYMLVIILFITPKMFFASGGGGFLGQRGIISGTSASSSVLGIGSRPWLQKVAALTVAISLTIATADTFKVVEDQYDAGYQDVTALTDLVFEGLDIRIVRVISDTCLWLAQVQTLIRLFPRQKEKVIIKWIGFSLIVLDTIFTILNYFVVGKGKTRPRRFVDAIPALNYLFALALSLLYAAWVIYYSLSKRRYAFYHRNMRNIILVAILALAAIHVPVVFFVVDLSQPNFAGWGNYVRWVGAAAASVVVWEWVERIEALEREENKDGILGQEIFAGDEMLEVTPSTETSWPRPYPSTKNDGGHQGAGAGAGISTGWNGMTGWATRLTGSRGQPSNIQHKVQRMGHRSTRRRKRRVPNGSEPLTPGPHKGTLPPTPISSPISRGDTTSAASTVYVVHYHEDQDPSQALPPIFGSQAGVTFANQTPAQPASRSSNDALENSENVSRVRPHGWTKIVNLFKDNRPLTPPEIAKARANTREILVSPEDSRQTSDNASHPMRLLERLRPRESPQVDLNSLPRTIIPPPGRGIELLKEAEEAAIKDGISSFSRSNPFTTLDPDSDRIAQGRVDHRALGAMGGQASHVMEDPSTSAMAFAQSLETVPAGHPPGIRQSPSLPANDVGPLSVGDQPRDEMTDFGDSPGIAGQTGD